MRQEMIEGIIHEQGKTDFWKNLEATDYPKIFENFRYLIAIPKSRYTIKKEFGELNELNDCEYYRNSLFIQEVIREHGFDLTLSECEDIWSAYSLSVCASWICVSNDKDSIWSDISPYFPVIKDED